MQLLPLPAPSVKLGLWRENDADRATADAEYGLMRLRVLTRDHFTCRFCGFMSVPEREADPSSYAASGYLEVHHLDDDHHNNSDANLISACPLCHLVPHVGHAGHSGRAIIIHFPWLSQAKLNLLCNCLFVAMARGGNGLSDDAMALYSLLETFSAAAASRFGQAVVSPANLGSALALLAREDPRLFERREEGLKCLRLLPSSKSFTAAVAFWSAKVWQPHPRWEEMWMKVLGQWREEK